jgi:hypothetical protein
VIDALAGQDGLLIEVFGPRVEIAASSDGVSLDAGGVGAHARSPRADVRWQGRLVGGAIEATGEGEGLEARVPLSPLVSERVVGPLVPLAIGLSKPEGAEPVALTARGVSFALDEPLATLDARIELELGQVVYELLPGLEAAFLREIGEERLRSVPPIRIAIVDGVARYDDLPLVIGDHTVPFTGSFGLVDHALSFEAAVPLAALGESVTEKLSEVERFVAPDTAVPIELGGTLSRPRVGLGEGFVEDLLKGAGRSLLEDLLQRRKKD